MSTSALERTVGTNARAMAACLTGLQGLRDWVKQKLHVSSCCFSCFWRVKTYHMTFLVTATCTGQFPPDTTSVELVVAASHMAIVTNINEAVRARMQ